MNMATEQVPRARFTAVMKQANQIASITDLDELLTEMLDLVRQIAQARECIFYFYDAARDSFICRTVQGTSSNPLRIGQYIGNDRMLIDAALSDSQPLFAPDMSQFAAEPQEADAPPDETPLLRQTCFVPIKLQDRPVGVVQLRGLPAFFTPNADETLLVDIVVNRLAPDIEKNWLLTRQRRMLREATHRENRLEALIDFISDISTTLERTQLISLIMSYAENLLDVEASSIWLLDERDHQLKLLIASGDSSLAMHKVNVLLGEGIIGHVVQTGERKIVNDVRSEPLFSKRVDSESGFVTRSILTVPMKAPKINRGDLRGSIEESIIGGAQALNKRNGGSFSEEDVRCFETLVRQAAIAFQFSNLFEEDNTLFWGVIKATTSAIDFTDPYARGHSSRVSEFSVAIAEELGLPAKQIHRVRVGSMLHDVGKIGVNINILRKPGSLSPEEFEEIKQHPMYGVRLFQEAGLGELLSEELLALAQHHERLDGSGYPEGLKGDQISLIARIVSVADVFDALTSDRPYRTAYLVEEALEILMGLSDTQLDADCTRALVEARAKGKVLVQCERSEPTFG
jgi:HD-GYP domain-containing protein (c-di-GMP phosphodiesterase class II)